jgi:thiamine-phosphate pyrophosphorylase
MPEPVVRLHLVAPAEPAAEVVQCFEAACEIGDVASLLAAPELIPGLFASARHHDVALLTTEAEAARSLGCDGLEVALRQDYDLARTILGYNRIVGGRCGSSRHLAMELADAGADYIAFSQAEERPGADPIIAWWSELFEVPCIAADPVEPSGLAALLAQRPDFIRPTDRMWRSADDSRNIIAATMRAIADWSS